MVSGGRHPSVIMPNLSAKIARYAGQFRVLASNFTGARRRTALRRMMGVVRYQRTLRPSERRLQATGCRHLLREVALDATEDRPCVLFDAAWYLRTYPDVEAAGVDPLLHYLWHGAAEGREPHPLFDSEWYLARHLDTSERTNPLLHFLTTRFVRHVAPTPLFDSDWYLDQGDPIAGPENAFEHFLVEGHRLRRSPNPLFDVEWYLNEYSSRGLCDPNPLIDYVVSGANQGRNPSPVFESAWYLSQNPDVAKEGLNPLAHYLAYGRQEGRAPKRHSRTVAPPRRCDRSPPTSRIRTTVHSPTESRVLGDALSMNGARRRTTVNWVLRQDNHGWAYGNNANRLISRLHEFRHVFDSHVPGEGIAVYFDIRVYEHVGRVGQANVLRVGGPRPVHIAYEGRRRDLERDLEAFDAVVVLNQALLREFSSLHPNVHLVPNGIDTTLWAPTARSQPERERDFTAGFAGSLTTRKERRIKGYDLAEEACRRLQLPLQCALKGAAQLPHEEMKERFFQNIDCLVHPVLEGKEGCSNVIMESLALGVPVVTTRYAGYHAELLQDGVDVLFCEPTVDDIAATLERLRSDSDLAARLARNGREFAVKHHDLDVVAARYRDILAGVSRNALGPRVCFVPFGRPVERYASGRLRCLYPARLLESGTIAKAQLGYDAEADIVFVSQLASNDLVRRLNQAPHQFVVYDLCDRYHVDPRVIDGVKADECFEAMAKRADVITTSSVRLKAELAASNLETPVIFIPDGVDYLEDYDPAPTPAGGPVVWFGYPGRGNFTSARWILDHLRDRMGREVRLISRKKWFSNLPKYQRDCDDWNYGTFVSELKRASLTVVTHSPDEPLKSANRLITAASNGVPCIVSNAPACEDLLRAAGQQEAIVGSEAELETAIRSLESDDYRRTHLAALQDVVFSAYGERTTRQRFEALLTSHSHRKHARAPQTALFVSHNLNLGEGAPVSLFELVTGLSTRYGVRATVFSPLDGPLRDAYRAHGVEVIVTHPEASSRSLSKLLQRRFRHIERSFLGLLDSGPFDIVVCNTAKSLCFADVARAASVPSISIIRESSPEHVNLTFAQGEVVERSAAGLQTTDSVVFVAEGTQHLWQQAHDMAPTVVIPNGIDTSKLSRGDDDESGTLRARLGVAAEDVVLLSVGTLSTRKGQTDIIQAFSGLPESLARRPTLVLVGARPGKYLERTRAMVSGLPEAVRERIHIIPETRDIAPWYRVADVFVMASYNESYPRVIMEALYYGLPIVTSNVFGTQEQVVDGACGEFFQPGDVDTLTKHLVSMISDGAKRHAYGRRSALRFWELTTYDEMLHRYYCLMQNAFHRGHTLAHAMAPPLAEDTAS